MNLAATYQGADTGGAIDMEEDLEEDSEYEYEVTVTNNSIRRTVNSNTPIQIRKMMTTSREWREHTGNLFDIYASGHREIVVYKDNVDDIVMMMPDGTKRRRRVVRAAIIFETSEALDRILSNLSMTASLSKSFATIIDEIPQNFSANKSASNFYQNARGSSSSYGTDNSGAEIVFNEIRHAVSDEETIRSDKMNRTYEVSVPDLSMEFRNLFEYFYFDGIPMSKMEIEEVCDLFSNWIESLGIQTESLYSTKNDVIPYKPPTINFDLFHAWFIDLMNEIHHTMHNRLMNYVLLTSTIAADINNISSKEKSKEKNENSIRSQTYLKSLRPVTPFNLTNTLRPAQHHLGNTLTDASSRPNSRPNSKPNSKPVTPRISRPVSPRISRPGSLRSTSRPVTPRSVSPRNLTPRQGSPRNLTPRQGSPRNLTPRNTNDSDRAIENPIYSDKVVINIDITRSD